MKLILKESAFLVVFAAAAATAMWLIVPHAAAPPSGRPPSSHSSSFLTFEEAYQLYSAGNCVFIDARHSFDYDLGHIPGALNLPVSDFEEHLSVVESIPHSSLLITYCDGQSCNSSIELAQKLTERGFSDVRVFFGGWNEWEQHHEKTTK